MNKEIEKKYLHSRKGVLECGNEMTMQKLVTMNNNNSDDSDTMASHRLESCVQCQEYKVMISWRRPDQGWVKINSYVI